jgi:O-antigen ligase
MSPRAFATPGSASFIARVRQHVAPPGLTRVLTRLVWAGLAVVLLILLLAGWRLAAEQAWVRAIMLGLVVLASWRPREGLLVLAGLAPVIGVYGALMGVPVPMREVLVLATCAGWALRVAIAAPSPLIPADLRWPLAAATVVVLSSMVVELSGQRALMGPVPFRESFEHTLDHGFLRYRQAFHGLNAGLVYLEGLAVFAAAAVLCARRETFIGQAVAMAVVGAAGAAAINIQRLVTVAYASPAPLDRLRELLGAVRINVGYGDVNAAGSYFALVFFPAAAQAFRSTAWRQAIWIAAAAVIFSAAWLTGSRAAVGAVLIISLLATLLAARRRSSSGRIVAAALAISLLATGAFVALFPNQVFGAQTPVAVQIRVEMARISLALLGAQPLFGVGVGGFYDASAPLLAASPIGAYYRQENAHNSALQWLAELGLVGFAAFAWLLWRAGTRIVAGLRGPAAPYAAGLGAGLLAFGLTAMLGHPLLTAEVNHAFWLLLGIACGTAPASVHPRASRPARAAAVIVILLAIGLLPSRVRDETAALPLEHVRYGASVWHTGTDGVRYQTFTGSTTLFVPSSAHAVDIPLRLDEGDPPVVVEIRFRNRIADRLALTSTSWTTYRLIVGGSTDATSYLPVEVHVADDDPRPIRIGRTVVR